jgi:divalent metal cation (Fe/Co/Zn/Cd) transporter
MVLTLFLSVYSFFYPSQPSEFLIAVVGLKFYDIMWDLAIFAKQRKILKMTPSTLSESNYAAAFGDLMFDSFAWLSLVAMWLLRKIPVGAYISPIVSIFVALYLMSGCIKRIISSLNELTDKTLPEEDQLKILKSLTRHYDSYTQFHSIDSRKIGETTMIDISLSFESNTSVKEVIDLQKQMQDEFEREFGNCVVKITVGEG